MHIPMPLPVLPAIKLPKLDIALEVERIVEGHKGAHIAYCYEDRIIVHCTAESTAVLICLALDLKDILCSRKPCKDSSSKAFFVLVPLKGKP